MDGVGVGEVVARARKEIGPLGHSGSTLWQYEHAWRAFTAFAREHGQECFSRETALAFIAWWEGELAQGLVKPWKAKLFRKAVLVLVEVFETGGYQWGKAPHQRPNDALTGRLLETQVAYEACLCREGYRRGTKDAYQAVSRRLLKDLAESGAPSVDGLTLMDVPGVVSSFVGPYQSTSMRTVCCGLRSFFRFLHREGWHRVDLSAAVPASGTHRRIVVTTVSKAEARMIVDTPDRSTTLGLRNRAMLLLGSVYGLRPSDITGLRLSDVDWRGKQISIVQAKTGVPVVLPLTGEVGQALADYLLDGRPASNDPHVFLRAQAPFIGLAEGSDAWGVCARAVAKSGVTLPDGAPQGFRLLRTATATGLLATGASLDLIAAVLGHRDPESAKHYLSTDEEGMRQCCLALPETVTGGR